MALKKRFYRRRFYRRKKRGLTKYFKCRLEGMIAIGFPQQSGPACFISGAPQGNQVYHVMDFLNTIPNFVRLAFYFSYYKLYAMGFEWIPNVGINSDTGTIPNSILFCYEANAENGLGLNDMITNPTCIQCTNNHLCKFFKTMSSTYYQGTPNMLGSLCVNSLQPSADQKFNGFMKVKFYLIFKNNLF